MLKVLEPTVVLDDVVPILLVDDQPANLGALEAILSSTGCRFVMAQSADEALLALLEQEFAAIILDIKMPGMTGLELAVLIKKRRRTQHVPILFLTAHLVDEADILRGYGTGAVDYLTKPVNPDILRSKIGVFIDLFRTGRALRRANDALRNEIAERKRIGEALRQVNMDLEARVQDRTSALQQADRRKDEFLAALAHELRNPLGALRSAGEVFRLKAGGGAELQVPLGVMDRQLRHMTRLIDDLLDVSRITRDKLTLQRSRVELRQILAAAVETSRPLIERRRHTLSLDLPLDPVVLDADPIRLAQAFSNLLDNAAKYTEPGGRIQLAADVRGDRATIRVTDSGIGIERDVLPSVFDLFVQAARSPERVLEGLGIGLPLAKRLIEMHDGTLEAHSEGAGKGCDFVARLPVVQGAALEDRRAKTPAQPPALERSLRVLVVEDNRDAAEMLNAMLVEWGQDTRVAHDADQALELAAQFQPHVILLDLGLPKLHGYDVARKLRQQPWGERATFVAVTGWGQEADRLQSRAAGINHHLVKPVDPLVLQTLLAGVVLE